MLVGCSDFAHEHAWMETKYTAGVFVVLNAEGTYRHYGLVVNINGKIVVPAEKSHVNGSGVYISGQFQVVEGNVPVFNLEGANLTFVTAPFLSEHLRYIGFNRLQAPQQP